MAVLHLFGAHETFRGALAVVTRRKLLHQIRGSSKAGRADAKVMTGDQMSQTLKQK
jgi:hypothetical protein